MATPITSFTRSLKVSLTGSGGESVTLALGPDTGDAIDDRLIPVLPGVVDQFVDFSVVLSKLRQILIGSSGGDLVMKTNAANSPQDTFALKDGTAAILYSQNGSAVVPFTADVTALYVSNSGAGAAYLQVRSLAQI